MSLLQLNLHLSQTQKALSKTLSNNYSDKSKQDYQNQLVALLKNIQSDVFENVSMSERASYEFKFFLDFIFKNLEFLDSSTLNLIPYEIVACLKSALNDWEKEGQDYIIATSLINNVSGFSFDPTLITQFHSVYRIFEKNYGIVFKQRLIQINIPKALSRDYLVGVVHYHELGHFIDIKNAITDSLANDLFDRITNNDDLLLKDLCLFFPFLAHDGFSLNDKLYILKNQLAEYFCDLFACQYVGQHLCNYIIYLTESNDGFSFTHPSSKNRHQVSLDFIEKRENVILTHINRALQAVMGKSLSLYFELITTDDFYNLVPCIVENDKQLHGLTMKGWEIWNAGPIEFSKKANIDPSLDSTQLYTIINNLIEKSIRNYIITKTWMEQASLES